MRSLLVGLVLLSACRNDCGDYLYKGVRGTEWCGSVYGTEGDYTDGEPDVASVFLHFRHIVPPGEFDFDHAGGVTARLLTSDLESGEPMGAERVWTRCWWTNYGRPDIDGDETEYDEPATSVEIQGHGKGFNIDPREGVRMRDISWDVVCGDDIIHVSGRDVVGLDPGGETTVLHPDLAGHLEGDGE
ncbi:MAG: hypothetical protein KC912_20160 [Proteobacteria bacterium]|nr:hypothetical protein [Pseudomonadota bacterium]